VNSPRTVSLSLGINPVCSSHKDTRERNKDRRSGNPVASIFSALNLRFLSQRPNLEVTPFLLYDDDTVVHPLCVGRTWPDENEDGQHDLMRMIGIFLLHSLPPPFDSQSSALEHLTSTPSEDWAMVLDVCKRASATEVNAREATEALRGQLEYALAELSHHSTSIYFQFQVRQCPATTFSCSGALPTPASYPSPLICV
jgi:hypothetical protein